MQFRIQRSHAPGFQRSRSVQIQRDNKPQIDGDSMRRIQIPFLPLGLMFAVVAGCATYDPETAPEVVDDVDLQRYAGTWYEVAAVPIRPQEGCVGTTATYEIRDDGDVTVINECFDESFDGELRRAEGRAWVQSEESNARLWVRFFWPFRGHYWIVDLDDDYRWAVVSTPDRDPFWILSRTPCIDQQTFDQIVSSLHRRNFDLERMETTLQRDDDGHHCEVQVRQ